MVQVRSDRRLLLLRVFALGLIALGLVLQPVMAAAGEMHELVHDPSGKHSHGLHANGLDAELTAAGEHDPDGSGMLHVLLDFAHCCGTAAAVLPLPEHVSTLAMAGRLAVAPAPAPPAVRLPTPFKPPIFR